MTWSVATTAQGRVSATTENRSSLFTSAAIDLDVETGRTTQLLFDVDGLYPGRLETSCARLTYRGSLAADLRLHGRRSGGDGLERYVETTIEVGRAPGGDCADFVAVRTLYEGRLSTLVGRHGDYASGLSLAPEMAPGDELVLRATATLVDDDGAQGRWTEFWIMLEARP